MVILKATRLDRGVLGRAKSLCTYLIRLLGGFGGVGQPYGIARLGTLGCASSRILLQSFCVGLMLADDY